MPEQEINTEIQEKRLSIRDLLAKYFDKEQFILLFEVRNDASFNADRSLDAMAINFWASRGLEIHGIEIKASTSDWHKEMNNPKKADAFYKYCDRFWIVSDNSEKVKQVVKKDEVPTGWGCLSRTSDGKSLRAIVPAPKIASQPVPRGMMVSMLKRAAAEKEQKYIKAYSREDLEKMVQHHQERHDREIKYAKERIRELESTINKFRENSGVEISKWNAGNIGQAVRFLLSNESGHVAHYIKQAITKLENYTRSLENGILAISDADNQLELLKNEIFKNGGKNE